jgi:16S rRNA (cytosine1402-N4)-methyltransferase
MIATAKAQREASELGACQRLDETDVDQPVAHARARREHRPAPGLPAIADREDQELDFDVQLWCLDASAGRREIGELSHSRDGVRQRPERLFRLGWSLGGCFRADAGGGHVHESMAIQFGGVDAHRLATQNDVHRVVCIQGNASLAGEIVRGSEGNDAQRHVEAGQSVHDLVDGAVPAERHDGIGALSGSVRGEARRVTPLPRDAHVDGVALLANPLHEVAHAGEFCACAMNHEEQVLTFLHEPECRADCTCRGCYRLPATGYRLQSMTSSASTSADRWDNAYHAPVLAAEVVSLLAGARRVLDGTLGGGGHSLALLEGGSDVTALDRDPSALSVAGDRLAAFVAAGRFRAYEGNYAYPERVAELESARFDGILLDLGVSSRQLDDAERGFSFRPGAPLDMRMGPDADTDAATLLGETEGLELTRIFKEYGDEPKAGRLAREIVKRRGTKPFETSDDLVNAIRGALGAKTNAGDFARIFQAVRIAVNGELRDLERALPALRDRLEPGGVLAVIAYHSGEDRIVKNALRDWSTACICPPRQPVCTCRGEPLGTLISRKPVVAGAEETARNPRSRSARLRAYRHGG